MNMAGKTKESPGTTDLTKEQMNIMKEKSAKYAPAWIGVGLAVILTAILFLSGRFFSNGDGVGFSISLPPEESEEIAEIDAAGGGLLKRPTAFGEVFFYVDCVIPDYLLENGLSSVRVELEGFKTADSKGVRISGGDFEPDSTVFSPVVGGQPARVEFSLHFSQESMKASRYVTQGNVVFRDAVRNVKLGIFPVSIINSDIPPPMTSAGK